MSTYIPEFLQNAWFDLSIFSPQKLLKSRNRACYYSSLKVLEAKKSSRSKPSILKELGYSLPRFPLRFTLILIALLLFCFFLRLGFWQLDRAKEKSVLLASKQALAQQAPKPWTPGGVSPVLFQRIEVQGHYLDPVFLLDNQYYHHQLGYQVLSPLLLSDKTVVMVDRGWVASDPSRATLPKVDVPKDELSVRGYVYFYSKRPWVLGSVLEKKENNFIVVEIFDTKMLNQLLQKKVYPFIIRLDKHEPQGFVRDWTIVSLSPQRHIAYALQWFAFAGLLLIFFVVLHVKKRNEKKQG